MIGFHKFLPHDQNYSTSIVLMLETLHHFMAVFFHVFCHSQTQQSGPTFKKKMEMTSASVGNLLKLGIWKK